MKPFRLAAGAALCLSLSHAYAHGEQFYQTKTPYAPQQDSASYEAPPAGYQPVFTQMLARHGSRGLSSFKTELALYNLWLAAKQQDALSPLAGQLGPALEEMMKANALLGYNVPGIAKPGYGNETVQGAEEHTGLALRLYARLPALFQAPDAGARRIVVLSSGRDRAADSAYFFSRALVVKQPNLAPLIDSGMDRATLYFHKLNTRQDGQVPEATLAYQRWVESDELLARETAIHQNPRLQAAALTTLTALFKPAFIATLSTTGFASTGSRTYTSADGKFTTTLTGDDQTRISSATDAALALYDMYATAADMRHELKADFDKYLRPHEARIYAETEDAIAFYEKGPGITENGDVTWRMAAPLLADFFNEADAIDQGKREHLAKLRFAHAEIVMPLASALGLGKQLPRATTYSYQNSSWRGEQIAPMAANIQWDLYQNAAGRTLVRMLYNERETAFKPACDHARIAAASHFYDYRQLKACYKQNKD
ncbi:histidine-type phosphatase [Duganella sp. FT94W]|uniref:Multiple inositol polyphosphate phosphatase 1 n=1 Tax=Duganella lactea TaxID=2692173 RepID=A0ABW9V8V0_9BURK|nr:histidine phosphatase family protein [Duganella lactea]MYM36073.1 histidine-type phosphatase [Duganella lactea]